jgi:tetratricopeptide (TPR) repeat protein
MLCAQCGASNPNSSSFCLKCGALLEMPSNASAIQHNSASASSSWDMPNGPFEQRTGTSGSQRELEGSLFTPIAHLPFEEQPTPSEPPHTAHMPLFAPVAHLPFNEEPLPQPSESFPTLILPVGEPLTSTPAPISPQQTIYTNPPAAPHLPFANYPTNEQVSPARGLFPVQPPGHIYHEPTTSTLNQNWQQDESYAPFVQTSPSGPVLSHVYAGPPKEMKHASDVSSEINPFIQHLPTWAFVLGIGAGAILLTGLVFFNPDWATGSLIAGTIAIILAVLLVIVAGVRVALGMLAATNPKRRSQVVSATLLVLLLLAFSGIGLSQQTSLHAMQARYLEGQHNWQMAVIEYQEAGEVPPASENLARVYNEWGETLSTQEHYAEAVAKFRIVLQSYQSVPTQVQRTKLNMVKTYLSWGYSASQRQDYMHATSYYDTLLTFDYCDLACQSLAQAQDTTAYYNLAEQQFEAQEFTTAVNAFNVLTTRFPNAPEAKKVHADYAKALWGLGQQQLHTNTLCSNAVRTYQQLAQQFGDTPQGQQAATALPQPVKVTGHFTTPIPGSPANPTVALVQGLNVNILQYQFPPLLKGAPTTQVNSNGTFIFSTVPLGTYELVWSYDGTLHYYYASNGTQVLYTAHIGSLCAYDYGAINETIPTGN